MAISLPEMYRVEKESQITQTTGTLTPSSMTISVVDASVFPSAPNIAILFQKEGNYAETVRYSNKGTNTLGGVQRGFFGTTPRSWPIGTDIARGLSGYDLDTVIDSIELMATAIDGTPSNGEQVQADWNQDDSSQVNYVKNRPKINSVVLKGNRDLPEDAITNMRIIQIMNSNRN